MYKTYNVCKSVNERVRLELVTVLKYLVDLLKNNLNKL